MLLTITNKGAEATDLGFLLHKNPANLHSADLPFGEALVFYTDATNQVCTACLLLEIDPVDLVRGAQRPEDYVNDRPYVSSSYMTVAIGRVFGTALAKSERVEPRCAGPGYVIGNYNGRTYRVLANRRTSSDIC